MLDGDDEEEEILNFVRYYTREIPGTGFGITWSMEQVILLYHIFSENNVEAINTGVDAYIGPLTPTIISGKDTGIIKGLLKEVVED